MKLSIAVIVFALLAVPLGDHAAAQEPPGPAVELALGAMLFPDDGVVTESLVGGAGRWYLLPRMAVGPEVLYIQGENHSHLILTGNLTFDVRSPVAGRPRRLTPFIVVGAGMFQTREQFFVGPYTSSEGAFTAGGGVRGLVADRVLLGVDARFGWELHVRLNAIVGVQSGR